MLVNLVLSGHLIQAYFRFRVLKGIGMIDSKIRPSDPFVFERW